MRWLRRVVAMLRPWPGRNERHAAIAAAAAEKERSQAEAKHAKVVARELQQMTGNGYARDIAQQILRGRQ